MTPQSASEDDLARHIIRNSLDESLLVEAAAGTGKTSELIQRVVKVLESGRTTIDKIVAVTFTNKAAGELKLRLRQELDRARAAAADSSCKRNLEHALAHLEEASVGTIHSFCGRILRERPVEAVVDPAFQELSEPETARYYDRAFRAWMQRNLNEDSPGLRRALARIAWRDEYDERPAFEQLLEAGKKLVDWRDFPAPWRRPEFDRAAEIAGLMNAVSELAELSARCARRKDSLYIALEPVRELADAAPHTVALDTLEARLLRLLRALKQNKHTGSGSFAEGLPRQRIIDLREDLLARLEAFKIRADADLAALLREEMQSLIEIYEDLKRRSGKLDFLDLLTLARDLVRGNRQVRAYLQERFTHIFVDEFQDTDPLQAEILLLLASASTETDQWLACTPAPGKLFVVGDPKQSIYKFRRADVVLYQRIREALEARGVRTLTLSRSFRSLRPIQVCVNAAFAPEMTGDADAGQARYVPLEEYSQARAGQPAVIALPVPRPYGWRGVTKSAINNSLPDALAAFADWLLHDSGWKVRNLEASGEWIPISPRHICILFRRFVNNREDLTRGYVRALEARGIPHLLVGSKSFHAREEVETVRAALRAIEWPEDELSVFAVLRGSLFAISDEALLRFRHETGRLHPFQAPPAQMEPYASPIREGLRLLAELHRGRNYRPIADTINLLLEATRAHAAFALRPAGQQVLANVFRIANLARAFEASGGISFRGFVEELDAQAEKSEPAEAPVVDEGAEGVRLMTVHAAKGLEFPVVLLADMTANITARSPERHVDARRGLCATRLLHCVPVELLENEERERERERAEGVRVAYVAATRARDLLVAPVVGDEERAGWLEPLNKALYPPRAAYRQARAAPGCPEFGDRTVQYRSPECESSSETSVKPGLHIPRAGMHEVVWWDPNMLHLDVAETFGLQQEEILKPAAGDGGMKAYQQWKDARARLLDQGARPEYKLLTAANLPEAPHFRPNVQIAAVERPLTRPSGRRFGTLVHQALRDIDLCRPESSVERVVRMHGRLIGVDEEQMRWGIETVLAVCDHPIIREARSARRLHREMPLMLKLEEGVVFEGVIDLAFLSDEAWTVVDFKTDADMHKHKAHHERQLQWYAYALSRIAGASVQPVLLWI